MEDKNDFPNIVKEFYHKLQSMDGDTKYVKRKLKAVCKKAAILSRVAGSPLV